MEVIHKYRTGWPENGPNVFGILLLVLEKQNPFLFILRVLRNGMNPACPDEESLDP